MNIFKQFYKSLYSPKDIALFRFQGIGKSILYVFLLSFLSIVPTSFYLSTAIIEGVNAAQQSLAEEFPDFTIKDGALDSESSAPVESTINGFTLYFDSTGSLELNDLTTNNGLALLSNEFVFIAGGELTSYPYTMIEGADLTKEDAVNLLNNADSALFILIPILILVIFLFSSAVRFIEVSVLALLGVLFKNVSGRKLQYRHLWRMAVYSITLPTLFFAIMAFLQTSVPGGFWLYWLVSLSVLYLAIKEVPASKKA